MLVNTLAVNLFFFSYFFVRLCMSLAYRSLTCQKREKNEADSSKKEKREREKKRRLLIFLLRRLKSLTEMNQWKIFFRSFSLSFSLSNHSKLSWSMMMVGSALSFDLDASRLIYTSNTWHFSREATDEKKRERRRKNNNDFFVSNKIFFLQYGNHRNKQEIIHEYRYVLNRFLFKKSPSIRFCWTNVGFFDAMSKKSFFFSVDIEVREWIFWSVNRLVNNDYLETFTCRSIVSDMFSRVFFPIRLSLFNCYLHDDNSIDFFREIENWKLTATRQHVIQLKLENLSSSSSFCSIEYFICERERERKKRRQRWWW